MNEGGGHKFFFLFVFPLPLQFRSWPSGGGVTCNKERVLGEVRGVGGQLWVSCLVTCSSRVLRKRKKNPETSWSAVVEQQQPCRRSRGTAVGVTPRNCSPAGAAAVTAQQQHFSLFSSMLKFASTSTPLLLLHISIFPCRSVVTDWPFHLLGQLVERSRGRRI